MKDLEKQLKALANRRRLAILKILKSHKSGASVSQLSREIGLSFRATSRHLGVLLAAEILEKEQSSLNVYYFLPSSVSRVTQKILDLI
jgi:DNA-binding transcriptional ArsR family regulator